MQLLQKLLAGEPGRPTRLHTETRDPLSSREANEHPGSLQVALHSVATNFAKVLGGQGALAALGLATLTLNTRALGAQDFGKLVVIQSICELMTLIAAFQTWQAMVRFGAVNQATGDYAALRAQYRLGLMMDVVAALAASISAALVTLIFFRAFGLQRAHVPLALVYALITATSATSASTGVLRLTGRFGLSVGIQVAGGGLLLVNAIVLSALSEPLSTYVWTIASITALTSIATIAAAVIRTERLARTAPPTSASLDRWAFIRFALATSASGSLNALRQRGELLIVSGLLGPAAAGLYAIAYRLAALFARFGEAGRQSVYPELARLSAAGDGTAARKLVLRTSMAATGVATSTSIAFVLCGRPLVSALFSREFADAYPILLWLMVSTLLFACTFSLGSYVQITRGARYLLGLNVMSAVPFVIGAIAGPILLGVSGAGAGGAAFTVTLTLLLARAVIISSSKA